MFRSINRSLSKSFVFFLRIEYLGSIWKLKETSIELKIDMKWGVHRKLESSPRGPRNEEVECFWHLRWGKLIRFYFWNLHICYVDLTQLISSRIKLVHAPKKGVCFVHVKKMDECLCCTVHHSRRAPEPSLNPKASTSVARSQGGEMWWFRWLWIWRHVGEGLSTQRNATLRGLGGEIALTPTPTDS